ncbi:uncharacterized protein BO97DRAFT_38449 [Aspergillus homomorphus CBS 101889]|uniref:Uncharacterized protein n=1 Tax=Aspergillus homomorphus (strain CBS 101889) TaxID=1450537 RepID=A0A395I104_ASPHC|nr:hypothetical protein BO97DRAFT_38449 [Aspergillus homomorphus CBS 101889]RAL13405.1 hypothetical protein BO97DRAFT_38449 [Aspergillus homomorphus CBS 101889]
MVTLNLSLTSFSAQLEGRVTATTEPGYRLGAQSILPFHLVSIAAVSGCTNTVVDAGCITESLHEASLVLPQGYVESNLRLRYSVISSHRRASGRRPFITWVSWQVPRMLRPAGGHHGPGSLP